MNRSTPVSSRIQRAKAIVRGPQRLSGPDTLHLTFADIDRVYERFALRRSAPSPAKQVRLHTHSYFELVLVKQGFATHQYGGLNYTVGPGDLLAISPWIPHRYNNLKSKVRFATIVINFGFDALVDAIDEPEMMDMLELLLLGKLQSPSSYPGLFRPAPSNIPKYIERMQDEVSLSEDLPGRRTLLNCLTRLILIDMYRHRDFGVVAGETSEALFVVRNLPLVNSMALSPDVTLAKIAENVGFSPGYFGRRFKQITGENITHYIQRIRITKALQYLATTDTSIEEIALRVGYRDLATFRSVFQKVTGSTPFQYKKQR